MWGYYFQPDLGARLSISLLVAVASSLNWASHISSTFSLLDEGVMTSFLWVNNQQIRVFWTFVSTILFFAGSSTPNTWKYQVTPRYSESSSPLTSATVSSLAFFPRLTKAHFPWESGVKKGGKRASWKTFAWDACSAQGSSSGSQPSSSFLRSEPSMIRAQKTQGPPQIKWC